MKLLREKKYLELESYKLKNKNLSNDIKLLGKVIENYENYLENVYEKLDNIQNDLKGTVRKTTIRNKVKEIMKEMNKGINL